MYFILQYYLPNISELQMVQSAQVMCPVLLDLERKIGTSPPAFTCSTEYHLKACVIEMEIRIQIPAQPSLAA